jgi:tetratricopeptide (TPR) repeat protein
MNTLGSVYYLEGNYPRALEMSLVALVIYNEIDNKSGIASANGNIGNIYKEQGNSKKALEYYMKALAMDSAIGRKNGIAAVEGNIGIVYWNLGDYSKALTYYNHALLMDEELKDKNNTAADLANIGNVYAQQGDEAKALDNYTQALTIYALVGNKRGLAKLTGNVGEVYLKQRSYKDAEKYLNESLLLSKRLGDLESIKHDYQVLSRLYAETKDWAKAYEDHVLFSIAKDSLVNEENTGKIVQAEMNFEFEQKQAAEKAAQDKKDAIRDEESRRQRILLLLIGALAVIVGFIALFIFRSLKAAQRARLIVEQQKGLMELKALRAQMNPHFIFNAINSIQHFILKNDPEAAQKHLTKFSKLIRKVLENSKHESIPLSEEIQMLQLYAELEAVRFSSKFEYKFIVDNSIEPEKILISPLIVQPYVENAIWHGLMHLKGVKGELTIKFEKENGMLKCTVDDNGIGRKSSTEMKTEAQHEPMGLSITNERVQVLNDVYGINIQVNIIDKANADGTAAGTRVELLMPLNLNDGEYA